MELREDLLEREAKLVDSQISILGDSFYKMAEVGALYSNNYIDNYNSQYENAKSFAEAAKESFEAGDIT
jgi:hypothetical protein